jgi:hypothetical protein
MSCQTLFVSSRLIGFTQKWSISLTGPELLKNFFVSILAPHLHTHRTEHSGLATAHSTPERLLDKGASTFPCSSFHIIPIA